jgi:hypothetical protein
VSVHRILYDEMQGPRVAPFLRAPSRQQIGNAKGRIPKMLEPYGKIRAAALRDPYCVGLHHRYARI